MRFPPVKIDPARVAKLRSSVIKYQHCYEDEHLTIGIFLLGPGGIMPLHDHPNMTVITQVYASPLSCVFSVCMCILG